MSILRIFLGKLAKIPNKCTNIHTFGVILDNIDVKQCKEGILIHYDPLITKCHLGPHIEHNGPKSMVLLHFLPFFQFFLGLACARAPRNSMLYCKMVPTEEILAVI